MKRLLITLLLALLAAAAVVLWRERPRLFPSSEANELYSRYEHNDHIRATYIKDFHVNDTLRVDVTTLQADCDSAWCALLLEFGASEDFFKVYYANKDLFESGENSIIFFYIDKNDTKHRIPMDDPNSQLVIGSFSEKTLCIYLTDNTDLKNTIGKTKIKKLKQ